MGNFKVGEKVVCVDDSVGLTSKTKSLIKGDIYTISSFYFGHVFISEVALVPTLNGPKRPYYNINRFRKLDTQFAEDLCAKLIEEHISESSRTERVETLVHSDVFKFPIPSYQ